MIDILIRDGDIGRATDQHVHRYSDGIPHVIVNGRQVVHEGEHTGAVPGQVLGL